jgi:hypothetical protein
VSCRGPRVDGVAPDPVAATAAAGSELIPAALVLAVVYAVHRAQLRQVRAIDARLDEMRGMLRMMRAAKENPGPRRSDLPVA